MANTAPSEIFQQTTPINPAPMKPEPSFEDRLNDLVHLAPSALLKTVAVTAVCVAFVTLLLLSAKDVYGIFPDPALMMDPPMMPTRVDQQYAGVSRK
ncbi:hypothetical protein AYO41_03730 [Verrucomicrobia bacterium SCGC AG-212-E04]|nr:hypothetical protein AYO41_03730 [Verrucomicrobia bacterium SCGC AG-212-E04]